MDVLDVSRGNIVTAASKYEVPPLDLPRGFNVDNAARIRKGTGMLTIGVGRINDPQQAEDILEADKVDMVVMGRAQLADPDFCNKCREGRVEEIDRCVGCNQGCLDGFADLNMPHITCLRNPAIGRETECSAAMQPAQSPKTILIAGGGIAGLEAARTLKLRGITPSCARQAMRWAVSLCWQARLPARRRWRLPSRAWLLRCSGWAWMSV